MKLCTKCKNVEVKNNYQKMCRLCAVEARAENQARYYVKRKSIKSPDDTNKIVPQHLLERGTISIRR